jgi:hypothetical protein
VDGECLADDALDRHAWIEGAEGILEDHLDFATPWQELAVG